MLKSTEQTDITIYFSTKTINLEKEGMSKPVEISELIKPGQILATLGPADQRQSLPVKQTILTPGPHTQLSATGDALMASVAGYPTLNKDNAGNVETLTISITPLVTFSPDRMKASMTLYPSLPSAPPLEIEELTALIQEAGVCYGLNREILQRCLDQSRNEQEICAEMFVAMGMHPLPGTDACLRFDIEMGSIPGKVLGNGKIDFRERRMFIGVRKGQLIATKISATFGSPGTNVLGHPIPQRQGQDITVTVADNVSYDEKSGAVHATRPGVLSVVNNTIKVTSKLTIPGDINFSTGNIEAHDAVDIGGSVLPGFKVNVQGDLRIGGSVRSATIVSQGNVLIQEGVSGKQTILRAAGDIDIPFVEQATVIAGGAVILRKNGYYSRIFAGGDIHCQEDCRVFGGITLAGGNLSLGQAGSDSAAPALIAAGTDSRLYLRYETLQQEITEKEDELEHCLHLHGHNSGLPFHLVMTRELEEMRDELKGLNLAADKKAETSAELVKRLRSRTITVHRMIFAGTLLRIGNVTRLLEETMVAQKFVLSEDLQTIIALSL
jgi:uncharacterized protein (DUF342 family)